MSRLASIKASWHYETNVPRCETCKNMQTARIVLTRDSLTKRVNHLCKLAGFTVARYACCDKWTGRDGSVVDPLPPAPKPLAAPPPAPKARPYECLNCGKKFTTEQGVEAHRKEWHPPPKQWKRAATSHPTPKE